VRALLWTMFARSSWAQQSTVMAGTTCEAAALASSLGRPALSKHLGMRARQVRALLWRLFVWLA
jgi:hypothetical protein